MSHVVGSGKRRLLRLLGPGLITGAADDDPSGIATYAQTGTQFGFQLSWTMLFNVSLDGRYSGHQRPHRADHGSRPRGKHSLELPLCHPAGYDHSAVSRQRLQYRCGSRRDGGGQPIAVAEDADLAVPRGL